MYETAKSSGSLLMIGSTMRFFNEIQAAKKILERGELGVIYAARGEYIRRRGVPTWGKWFLDKARSGGGAVIDIGIHMIDTIWWLMGCPEPLSVSASTFRGIENYKVGNWERDDFIKVIDDADSDNGIYDVEDSALIFIRFEQNRMSTIAASWALNTAEDSRQCYLYGTEGGIKLWPLETNGEKHNCLYSKRLNVPSVTRGHFPEIEHFIECVREKKESISPPEHGLMVMRIIDAIYRSAEEQREIIL